MSKRPSYLKQLKEKLTEDPSDKEYLGNIWGWKFSIFGLVLVVLFSILLLYRYFVLGISINEKEISPFYRDTFPTERTE